VGQKRKKSQLIQSVKAETSAYLSLVLFSVKATQVAQSCSSTSGTGNERANLRRSDSAASEQRADASTQGAATFTALACSGYEGFKNFLKNMLSVL
jgi:hypothetical protein